MLHDIVDGAIVLQVHPTCKLTNTTDGAVRSKASLVTTHTHTELSSRRSVLGVSGLSQRSV